MKIAVLVAMLLCADIFAEKSPLAHYYRFDGNEIIDSIGGCNGKVARLQQAEGLYGKALYFPKQDDPNARNVACGVSIPIASDTFVNPFTATLWVKLDENSTYRQFKELLSLGGERGPGFRLTYFYNSLAARTGDGKNVHTVSTNSSTVLLPLKRWFQVAVVYDGEYCIIYIDAVQKAKDKIQFTLGKGPLSVGTYRSGYAYPAQGALDELKIYKGALSHSALVEAYLAELK